MLVAWFNTFHILQETEVSASVWAAWVRAPAYDWLPAEDDFSTHSQHTAHTATNNFQPKNRDNNF